MLSASQISFRLSTTAFILAAIAAFCPHMKAQEPPQVHVGDAAVTGLPSDWSHRHVIYGNPGTEQDAIKNGTYEQWLKTVNDPRYIVQNLKRGLPVQGPSAQDVKSWQKLEDLGRKGWEPRRREHQGGHAPTPPQATLDRDWSMDTGGTAAGLTLTVGTPGSGTVSGTSTLLIDGVTFTASAPTSAHETGTFSGNPLSTDNVTINGQNIAASYSTAGTQTGTFSTYPPLATSAITVVYKGNTLSLTTNGTGRTVQGNAGTVVPAANTQITLQSGANTVTLSNGGTTGSAIGTVAGSPTSATAPTITILNGVTNNTLSLTTDATAAHALATFSGTGPTNNQTIIFQLGSQTAVTFTAATAPKGTGTATFSGDPNGGDQVVIGATTYVWHTNCGANANCILHGGTTTQDAQNLEAAINDTPSQCGFPAGGPCFFNVGGANASVTATDAANIVTVTNNTGANVTFTTNSGAFAVTPNPIPGFGGAANLCTSSTAGTFTLSTTPATAAQNFAAAINSTSCQTTHPIGVTANQVGAAVTVTSSTLGAYTNLTLGAGETATGFAWSVNTAGGAGTNACTSSTVGHFQVGSSAGTAISDIASNLATAINSTSCQTTFPVGVTAAYTSGATFTVTNPTPGPFLTVNASNNTGIFSWTTFTAGTNGNPTCTGTAPTFTGTYSTSNVQATLAGNVSAAIGTCSATLGATSAHTTGNTFLTATSTIPGTFPTLLGGVANATNIFSWNTATGGSNGSTACTGAAPTFTGTYITDASTTNLAGNLVLAINACPVGTGITKTSTSTTNSVTVTATQWGTTPGVTLTPTAAGYFQWSGGTLAGGTNGTTSATSFTVDNVPSDNAAALASAINLNSATGVTAANTAGSTTLTITAITPGTGANSLSTPAGVTNFAWQGTTLGSGTAANNGTADTTHFPYWTGTTYVSSATLASSIATALNANGTVSGAITATANNPTSGTVVLTAKGAGTGGNSFTTTATNFGAITPASGMFGGGLGGGQPGVYPAKWALSTASSVNCAGDYVVYPTGEAGSSTSATIIAYNNIYAGSCSGTVPTVYWAYNTGAGSVLTSPALSFDGTKVAFIETPASGAAVLRIVKFNAGDGTDYLTPLTFASNSFTNLAAGAGGNTPWTGCGAGSCMISVAFQTAFNPDTNSSPFYDYFNDVLYVGDDSGTLHQFSGVFNGTPGEVTTGGWPVALTGKLTSPVLDRITGSLFVGSSLGTLYQITTPLTTPVTIASGTIASGTGIVDSPILDNEAANPVVYVFVGDDGASHSAVYKFTDTFAANTKGIEESMAGTTGSTGLTVWDGDFDNVHYSGSGTTGNLYFCGGTAGTPANPTLYRIPINSTFNSAVTTVETLTSGAATCSPATEFYNGGSGGAALTTTSSASATVAPTVANFPNFAIGSTSLYLSSLTGIANGDYILIGSEYMLVTGTGNIGFGTYEVVTRGEFGTAVVAHGFGSATTVFENPNTIAVASGASIQDGDYIQIGSEIMDVTVGGGSTSLTVTRGALGTSLAAYASGANVSIPALDWLFLSVTANGNDTLCTGPCLYNYYISSPLAVNASAITGQQAAGGTTGIVIDNGYTSAGASQIYYTPLSSQGCTGAGGKGAGTGGCAVQASQSLP